MTKIELIKKLNDLRKANKNSWVSEYIDYNDNVIGIKSFGTWVQILKINNKTYSNNMDATVKQYNDFLNESLKELA